MVASGGLDKFVRVWSIKSKKEIETHHGRQYITALNFSPDGVRLVIGLATGQCLVYAFVDMRMNYITTVDVKNKRGIHSGGRKVTGLAFVNNNQVVVTTNDSRLRLLNLDVCRCARFSQTVGLYDDHEVQGQ